MIRTKSRKATFKAALHQIERLNPKRLANWVYFRGPNCNSLSPNEQIEMCAVGAVAAGLAVPEAITDSNARDVFNQLFGPESGYLGIHQQLQEKYGLSGTALEQLERHNDRFKGTPEQRYVHVTKWLKKQIAN